MAGPKSPWPLNVDVTCGQCKKRIALSYAKQLDGLYYCDKCHDNLPEIKEVIAMITVSKEL